MLYRFGSCVLDRNRRELRRAHRLVAVEPKVFDLLLLLLEQRARAVGRAELIDKIWNRRIVSDATVDSCVSRARRAIGDDGTTQSMIRTLPRHGLRFVAPVSVTSPAPATAWAEAGPRSDRLRLAVKPFRSGADDGLAQALTEDLIAALVRYRSLEVVPQEAGGARYLLEGGVRRDGDRLRVTVWLVDPACSGPVWSDRFDLPLAGLLTLQDAVSARVAARLESLLVRVEAQRARGRPASELDPWAATARAEALLMSWEQRPRLAAVKLLEQAIRRAPDHAPAHRLLALAHGHGAWMGWAPSSDLSHAWSAARRAVQLDASDASCHALLGLVHGLRREQEAAIAALRHALELNPHLHWARGFLGIVLAWGGQEARGAEEIDAGRKAGTGDLINVAYASIAATALFVAGRYADGVRQARQGAQTHPEGPGPLRILAANTAMLGETAEARAAFARLRRVQPGLSVDWMEQNFPLVPTADRARYIDALQRAGLPA